MKKRLINVFNVWKFLTPFFFSFAAAILHDIFMALALIALPLALFSLPCKKQEAVWAVFMLITMFLPQNVLLFQWLITIFTKLQSLLLTMLAMNFEVLFGVLFIHLVFPTQKPIKGGYNYE